MSREMAVIVAGALIAAAIAITNHWQISAAPTGVYLLDRWTGAVTGCDGGDAKGPPYTQRC